MARYTVELNDIVKSGLKVFNFPYVFYDETKKPDFEEKFINHFLFREIGQETVGRFQHYLKCKCDETLPYYNLLLKTALYEYDVKNNYNLTETFTKTNTMQKGITGKATQNVNLNRDSDIVITGDKTNTLDSETDHTEDIEFVKDGTITDEGTIDNTSTVDVDNKKVGSDTPNGLLSMTDITKNVYASKADIEDGTTKTVDKQTSNAEKTDNTKETTERTTKDTIDATSRDISTDTTNEDTTETTSNITDTTQSEDQSGSESYTLERVGDIGVDTTPDKLRKHIEIQKIFTTVYAQFFDECEDLFMQIY
jgi:hypothetical protein